MRTGIPITVSAADRKWLQAIVKDRRGAKARAWRSEIVLQSASGVGTNEIRRVGGPGGRGPGNLLGERAHAGDGVMPDAGC